MADIRLKNLLDMNKEEKKDFLNSFDMVLCDCDGVLWLAIGTLPNTGPALNILQGAGKIVHLVSNNCIRTEKEYYDNLNKMGVINSSNIEVITPIKSMINYLKKIKMDKPIFTISEDNLNYNLENAGFKVIKLENHIYKDLVEFSADIPVTEKVGAVIFDADINLNIAKLDKAKIYLEDPDCLFLVGASDAVMPLKEDLYVLGTECFINMLKKATGKTPYILGKPGVLLADYIFEHFNIIEPKRVLFIGDNLLQDILFGLKNDFQTLLVLSGAATRQKAEELPQTKQPHYVTNGITDFIELFSELLKK